jgi:hypothetical protein
MPAKDRYHDAVRRALEKDGWQIVAEQVYLSDGYRHVWVDLQAQRAESARTILVEAKTFGSSGALLEHFTAAVGQYMLYQAMLDVLQLTLPLYLALPAATYDMLSQSPAARQTLQNTRVALLVFTPDVEEIVQWISSPND